MTTNRNLTTLLLLPAILLCLNQITKAEKYTVQKGDNLSNIGKKFGVDYRKIMSTNELKDTVIFPGQVLKIPVEKEEKVAVEPVEKSREPVTTYVVQRGESLRDISRAFGIESWAIRKANEIRFSNIEPGQVLKIPTKDAKIGLASF